MGSNSVTFELRAEDLGATATAERVGGRVTAQAAAVNQSTAATTKHTAAAEGADRTQRRLANTITNVTSASGLAATAITRVQGLLFGLAQGAVIGAVAALASQFFATRRNVEDLTKSVADQTAKWDPYRAKLDDVRDSTVSLYNAQLRYVQFSERDTGRTIEKEIAALERRNRQLAEAGREIPFLVKDELKEQILENNVAIEENRVKLEQWRDLMGRTPLTVGEVITSLQALKAEWSETTVSMGDTYDVWMRHEEMLTATVQARARDRAAARDWEADQELLAIGRAMTARQQADAIRVASEMGLANTLSAIAGLSASRSKALFLVGKAAAVAQSFVSAHAAAAMALASPPGPPFTIPLAATVLKWGYLNAAAAAAVQFATGGFSGGGGGPSGGGAPRASSVPATAREIGPSASAQPLPQTINIYIDGNLVDLSQLSRELRPYNIQLTKDTI